MTQMYGSGLKEATRLACISTPMGQSMRSGSGCCEEAVTDNDAND